MGIVDTFHYYIVWSLRYLLHLSSSFILRLIYGKPKHLPPIRNDLLLQPATKLAEMIRNGQVKSRDVVQAYINRIQEVQLVLNAVVDQRFSDAIREAEQVDEVIASGKKSVEEIAKSTPFLGVPFSCKEHIPVKGLSFTIGLVSRTGVKAAEDSEVVKRLKKSGAIPLVVTNIPELCMSLECGNKVYGTTNNPYDTRRTSGGSSGGEGSLICSCGSVFGLGSDYGGSIRIPSLMNGIFGHKPSLGVVPHKGYYFEYPEAVRQYFVIGPLCRYAVDLLPVMKVLTNNLPRLSLDTPVDLRRLKIFYAMDCGANPLATPVVPEVKKSMKKALQYFETELGVQTIKIHLPELTGAFGLWFPVVLEGKPPRLTEALKEGKGEVNLWMECIKWLFRMSDHTADSLYFAIRENTALKASQEEHDKAMAKFRKLKADLEDLLKDGGVFFYPTLPEPAPFHHEGLLKHANLDYTAIFNVLGFPSTHIPTSFRKGMPVGFQCVANRFGDRLTMAVAVELEKVFGGWQSPAPIF